MPNEKISGMSLQATVLGTSKETVKLKLDIYKGWDPGGAYPYPWRPETGNLMYCMPQVGTRVALYFPNMDEKQALVNSCVRTNGTSCQRMSDPSKRALVTEHGKEMLLYPEEVGFLGGSNGAVNLSDENGIIISTDKKILIVGQSILFDAPIVNWRTIQGEFQLGTVDIEAGSIISSIVLSNAFDILSKEQTWMEGTHFISYSPYDDQPQAGKPPRPCGVDIFAYIVVGLAVAALLIIAGVVALAIAGVTMATIGAVAACAGAFAVAGTTMMAVEDAAKGEARPLGNAMLGSLGWTITGGFIGLGVGGVGLAIGAAPTLRGVAAPIAIQAMVGSGTTVSIVTGLIDFMIQGARHKDLSKIDWTHIRKTMFFNFFSGMFAGTGAGPWAQAGFNAVLNALSTIDSQGDAVSVIVSALVGFVWGRVGGPGILSGNIMYEMRLLFDAIVVSGYSAGSYVTSVIADMIYNFEDYLPMIEEMINKFKEYNSSVEEIINEFEEYIFSLIWPASEPETPDTNTDPFFQPCPDINDPGFFQPCPDNRDPGIVQPYPSSDPFKEVQV